MILSIQSEQLFSFERQTTLQKLKELIAQIDSTYKNDNT